MANDRERLGKNEFLFVALGGESEGESEGEKARGGEDRLEYVRPELEGG